jgi:hypothetical protein
MKLIGYGGILRRFSAEAKKVQVEVLFAETWALGRAAIDVLGVRDGRTVSKSLLESIKGTLGPDAARQFVERVMEYDVILSGRGDVVGNTEGLADAVMRDTKNNPYTGGQIVMQLGKALARHTGMDPTQNIHAVLEMPLVFLTLGAPKESFAELKAGQLSG